MLFKHPFGVFLSVTYVKPVFSLFKIHITPINICSLSIPGDNFHSFHRSLYFNNTKPTEHDIELNTYVCYAACVRQFKLNDRLFKNSQLRIIGKMVVLRHSSKYSTHSLEWYYE